MALSGCVCTCSKKKKNWSCRFLPHVLEIFQPLIDGHEQVNRDLDRE